MHGRRGYGVAAGLLAVCAWALMTEAQARDYLVNQAYKTAHRGEFEIELWNDVNMGKLGNDDTYSSRHQLELEYGVTDHLQLAFYESYTWDRNQDWERDMYKLEAKLRLADAGQWPLDVALYTEYKNPNGSRDDRSDAFENKVILSKTLGPWNAVYNFIFEKDIDTHSDWEFEQTAGVSYGITPRTRVGLEIKQGLGSSDAFEFNGSQGFQLVPGVYHSLTPHVRLLIGPAIGLARRSDDLQIKSILEIEF